MDLAQMAARQMGIDLGSRDIAVAEHLLDRAQVGATLDQMGREAMTESMGADPRQARIAALPIP